MTLFVNHLGFVPEAAKAVVRGGPVEEVFWVREQDTGAVVFRGRLARAASDSGVYTVGRFDALRQPGVYYVETGEDDPRIRERSQPFRIGPEVYHETLQQIVGYFTLQRCGDTDRGWHSPCHLDDGVRGDTLQHQDVEGGWHDACDLRKWVEATLYGLLGLSQVQQVLTPSWPNHDLLDEVRWGNRYFLKMQEPAGYIMNYVGGDYFVHADNNRWTDNVVADTGVDGWDDRMIDVRPCSTNAQWLFVMSQAAIASLAADGDPAYARECGEAALRCLAWLQESNRTQSAGELGIAVVALLALARWRSDDSYVRQAVAYAGQLLGLQVTRQVDSRSPVWGFFWERRAPEDAPGALEPYKAIWYGF